MAVSSQTANDLMTVFSGTITAGFSSLAGPVNGIFGLMIGLVVALTGLQWAVSSNRDVLAGAFSKILVIKSIIPPVTSHYNASFKYDGATM